MQWGTTASADSAFQRDVWSNSGGSELVVAGLAKIKRIPYGIPNAVPYLTRAGGLAGLVLVGCDHSKPDHRVGEIEKSSSCNARGGRLYPDKSVIRQSTVSLRMEAFGDLVEKSEYGRLHGWMVSRIAFTKAQLGVPFRNINSQLPNNLLHTKRRPAELDGRLKLGSKRRIQCLNLNAPSCNLSGVLAVDTGAKFVLLYGR